MKIKEKVKEFWEDNEIEVLTYGAIVTYCGVCFASGYFIGRKSMFNQITRGLAECYTERPELEPAMWEAINAVKERKGIK